MTWVVVFYALLFFDASLCLSKELADESIFNEDFSNSLKINMHGSCKWKELDGYDIPLEPSNAFYVSKHFPTKMELDKFRELPSTLTKANYAYYNISNNEHNVKWATETISQWQAVYDHPVQNRSFCFGLVKLAGEEGVLDLYDHFKNPSRGQYLIRKRNAVIAANGAVRFECGYYQGREGCETRFTEHTENWDKKCTRMMRENKAKYNDAFTNTLIDFDTKNNAIYTLVNCTTDWSLYEPQWEAVDKRLLNKPHFHKRVFVIATQWDYNYHHFVADSLVRIMRHIKFLRTNPDVFIHIRAMDVYDTVLPLRTTKFKINAKSMRDQFFTLLGIDPRRIIHDIVFAEEVFIPRSVQCGYALSGPIEMRMLARQLLRGAEQATQNQTRLIGSNQKVRTKVAKSATTKRNLIIQQRYSGWNSDRYWANETFDEVVTAFAENFPEHNVVRMSSLTSEDKLCLSCEIQQYRDADILVGLHGAGLTNLMFMPPGSMVVEFVGHWANVHAPVCGYYGPFGAIFGHHHYLHGYKSPTPVFAAEAANRSAAFFNAINRNQRYTLNITTVPYYAYQYKP